jgi:hypothetical protein
VHCRGWVRSSILSSLLLVLVLVLVLLFQQRDDGISDTNVNQM